MIGKVGSGWQTTTADLALILFLVVSAASPNAALDPRTPLSLEPTPSTAVFRAASGINLLQWLAALPVDERQVATVLVTRANSGPSPVMDQGLAFLDQIKESGRTGRLLVELGETDEVAVVLAYDRGAGSGTGLAGR